MKDLRPPVLPPPPPPYGSGDPPEAPLPFSQEADPVRPDDPQIMLQVSRDGGATWTAAVSRSLGPVGFYQQRVRWLRQGSGHNLVLRFSVSDAIPLAVLDQQVEML